MLSTIILVLNRYMNRRLQNLLATVYPDREDRAMALFGEAMELTEIIATGEGRTVENVVVSVDTELGYHIEINYVMDYAAEGEDE